MPDPSNPQAGPQPGGSFQIPPDTVAVLVVTMDNAGQVRAMGCIDNKLLSVGLCEIAKDAIFRHHEQAAKDGAKRIVQPPPGMDGNKLKIG